MFKEMHFSRKVINVYIELMDSLSGIVPAKDENDHIKNVKRLNWENNLVKWHHAGVDTFGLLFPDRTACKIVDETEDKKISWERISRQLDVHAARKRGVLELLRLAAMDSSLKATNFDIYNTTWEAAVVAHIIDIKNVSRVRSQVQANFYLRSANRKHRMLARMHLAKNDNFLAQAVGIAA